MKQPVPSQQDPILDRLVAEFRTIEGVAAIALGGSRSIGTSSAGSDYDVIIFSERDEALDREAVGRSLERFDGEWSGGGDTKSLAEMSVDGRKCELFFRDMEVIGKAIEAARKGEIRRTFNPLHVVGFISTILVSYATYARPLWDPDGRLERLITSAFPYPEPLRERMLKTFMSEAKLALIHAGKVRSVQDIAHLMGLYARANAAWALVLFAANRRYPVIDKGGRQLVASFPLSPPNYEFRTAAVFRAAAAGDLKGAMGEANRLHAEVVALARQSAAAPAAAASAAAEPAAMAARK
jgi:hypothetical protein